LFRAFRAAEKNSVKFEYQNFTQESLNIIQLVEKAYGAPKNPFEKPELGIIGRIGKGSSETGTLLMRLTEFIGESSAELARSFGHPRRFRLKELFVQLELAGVDAIMIVALVTFLIGIVIAYLFGIQIEKYGANIFIVDAVGLAICRELSPILVAIIVAGRSGSAFTAQIGTMKLNEEIDAMRTLGLSPMRVLVVPRMLALMISMPLLVFIGDVAGILGSMVISDLRLGITGITFLERLHTVLPVRSFLVGMIKAPVFAAFIAIIGCQLGLAVENNARSVGINTTATVVRSIVAVILLNAAFAIIFVELKI
jgi:phospholipid/cholesterol/gamma-HCH transport system permease protein